MSDLHLGDAIRMDRRKFLQITAATALLAGVPLARAGGDKPEIAFTFDGPKLDGGAGLNWQQINRGILAALDRHKTTAALFVCGKRVDSAEGRELVSAWDRAGHMIGNHSYSHLYFHNTPLAEFAADALKCEPLIRDYGHFARLFRYPFFKEGDTAEKRDGMRAFLKEHGYRIGRATIDASDWAIDARLNKRVAADPKADLAPYRDFYLGHIWERAQFYDSLARRAVGRPVRHTVLLHHSALNAMFLGYLIAMFAAKGWQPIHAETAFADPVYDRQPMILPAGESLIWALARESGKFESELRYPGEDDVYENPKMDALKL
jgi:peptidoglycan/xylan/chitin deacetylase (PgdA/CDA1 family)